MTEYPYFTPQVLTDALFTQYGGQTGTSTAVQRQAAYLLAEEKMTEFLGAFLVPTIITGSAFYQGGTLFSLEYGRLQRILYISAEVIDSISPLSTQIYTGTALIRNAEQGLVDIFLPETYWSCHWAGTIYKRTVVYESGFATGTVTQPSMLMALTLAAQIYLNEWDISLSNEGVADIGIQSFSNQSYSERRKTLLRTPFGSSAVAQQIVTLTRKYRSKPSIGFF